MTIEQGTAEWHALRCGKATASRIADIMRKTKTGVSAMRERYMGELIAERLTGQQADGFKSADMQWGNDCEAQARDAYAFYYNAKLEAVAFVDHPTVAMSGASPDRLVGSDGLLEIKCPATHTHIATLRGAPIEPDYIKQMMWQMACTNRAWCDFISFDPRLPESLRMHRTRVMRDPVMIVAMEDSVRVFLAAVAEGEAALRAIGGDALAQAAE